MASDEPLTVEPDSTCEYPTIPIPPRRVRVSFAGETHAGRVRLNNEDHFLIARLIKAMQVCRTNLPNQGKHRFSDEEGYLFVVADGMGGAAAGEEASRRAVESVESFILNVIHWFLHLGGGEEAALKAEMKRAFEQADLHLFRRAEEHPKYQGMGTTLTLAFNVGPDLFLAHAGDSRAYLARGGTLEQITSDHTLVQLLVAGGQISPEDAKRHRRRNIVTNVVGGPTPGVYAEIHKLRLEDGDVLLLCTDGLTEPVDAETISEALADQGQDPEASARRLVDLSLDRGAPDNVTVVVARFDFE